MYAVFVSGGKQYRVQVGQTLKIEKLDAEAGANIVFDQVLMVSNEGNAKIGAPYVAGSKVQADVVEHGRGDKIRIIKMKRRKTYRRTLGHRQWFTTVKITSIGA